MLVRLCQPFVSFVEEHRASFPPCVLCAGVWDAGNAGPAAAEHRCSGVRRNAGMPACPVSHTPVCSVCVCVCVLAPTQKKAHAKMSMIGRRGWKLRDHHGLGDGDSDRRERGGAVEDCDRVVSSKHHFVAGRVDQLQLLARKGQVQLDCPTGLEVLKRAKGRLTINWWRSIRFRLLICTHAPRRACGQADETKETGHTRVWGSLLFHWPGSCRTTPSSAGV